jgi:Fungal N-terminal domain of STAND proteins
MEGLGAAANVIAVIDLCAKVASFCYQYSLAVKHAKNDITRLQAELKSLRDVLGEVQQILDGPDSAKLSASQKLFEALKDGFSQLKTLDERLNPSKARKAMSRMGVRALKWPFESKEVDKVINGLEKCKQTVSLALQVDQT